MSDTIHIRGLDLPVYIGVPEEERASLQVLSADITLTLSHGFDRVGDDIAQTVNYQEVAQECHRIGLAGPRRLLETLATDLITILLQRQFVSAVEVELRKRILPGTDHVAVRMKRESYG